MKSLLRYSDLVERGLVSSRAQLQRLIRRYQFPPGKLIGANRTWDESIVDAWYASRPSENPRPLQGRAATLVEEAARKRAAAATNVKPGKPTKSKRPPPSDRKRKRAGRAAE